MKYFSSLSVKWKMEKSINNGQLVVILWNTTEKQAKNKQSIFTHICRSRDFERSLQQMSPELRQVLVQVECRTPVVLTQVGVEFPVQPSVLGVQGPERRQRLLQGALGTAVQLSEISWRSEERYKEQFREWWSFLTTSHTQHASLWVLQTQNLHLNLSVLDATIM